MKKPIESVILAFVFLTVLVSGCAPAPTPTSTAVPPTFTPSPIPPTFTPVPTATETPIPSPTPLPLPVTISVPANAGWFGTGLILPIGQPLHVSSEGIVDYNGDSPTAGDSDSDGDGSSCDKAIIEAIINQQLELDCLITGVSWGALVGRVGDGTPFLVGFDYEFTTETSGELFLGVNDCCNFADNSGEFTVTISSP